MYILTVRTDKPMAELALYRNYSKVDSLSWQAHRQLAESIHQQILALLHKQNGVLSDIKGIAVYKGPGSFTGLRIGIAVANALSASLEIPIIGSTGDDWILHAVESLQQGQNDTVVVPEYGAPVHITQPRK